MPKKLNIFLCVFLLVLTFSKEQIGIPTNFKHITHVGFDPDRGFSQFNVDEKLQGFFDMVNMLDLDLFFLQLKLIFKNDVSLLNRNS